MKKYFLANIGSASKKYALFEDEKELLSLHYEKASNNAHELTLSSEAVHEVVPINDTQYENSLAHAFDTLTSRGLIHDRSEMSSIGVRIVAPGSFFQSHKKIDDAYLTALQTLVNEEPLHLSPILREIKLLQEHLPNTPLFGLSDSAFHAQIPMHAKVYALGNDAGAFDILRFGYHGFSFASVLHTLKSRGDLPDKIVICHLGSGASIAAIQRGISIDTSMGFSPLEGLVMSTRIGDIDAGAIIRLMRKKSFSLDDLEKYLYTECGLLGLSGKSADMRELLALEADHDIGAKLALDTFVYRIKKYIGAYAGALDGVDALVFTGTIGERSSVIRSRICAGLEYLGVTIDETQNAAELSQAGILEIGTKSYAIHTNEMAEMARILSGM